MIESLIKELKEKKELFDEVFKKYISFDLEKEDILKYESKIKELSNQLIRIERKIRDLS